MINLNMEKAAKLCITIVYQEEIVSFAPAISTKCRIEFDHDDIT